jgi:hypothetical protein
MTAISGGPSTAVNESGRWLLAIATELSGAGLIVQLHQTRAGLDLTATRYHTDRREIEVLVDEDGYTELRYWADQAAAPAQVADIIVRVLSVVSDIRAASTLPDPARTPPHTEAFSVLRLPGPAIGTITGYDGAVTERAGDGGMAGSRDTPTEQQVSADSVRKNWPDKADPELVKRLEQLQPGHPSSPYNADGTRKPPVPDTTDRELPIPGDPDYRADMPTNPMADRGGDRRNDDSPHGSAGPPEVLADQKPDSETVTPEHGTDRRLDADDTARTGTDGSWEWKGHPLTPEQSRSGDRGLERCRQVEGRDHDGNYGAHGLTPAMRRIEAKLQLGELAPDTEKFALKGIDRFKEKFAKLIERYSGESPEKLVAKIHDGIRYTFLSDTTSYVRSVWETTEKLQDHGFELILRSNDWGEPEYKGVNTRWRDPDSGLLFEVQLHTHQSWAAKQRTHDAYEKINDTRTPVAEVERARKFQQEISGQVPLPPGWETIPDYPKEDE